MMSDEELEILSLIASNRDIDITDVHTIFSIDAIFKLRSLHDRGFIGSGLKRYKSNDSCGFVRVYIFNGGDTIDG